jgi:secreted trypsin-like serine protease
MRKILLIVSLLVVFSATPVLAITDGALDGNDHPQVGLMVALDNDGEPLWRCSGTLISPTVYLTAGHCTESPAASATIWFDADVQSDIPANGYPFKGEVNGTTYTHPKYKPNAFWRYDLGVVVLDDPVKLAKYGKLPGLDSLDRFKRKPRRKKTWFTSVGYGLQKAFPTAAGWKDVAERVRMIAHPRLIQINVKGSTGTQTLLLSNNRVTGGTCFGDSGGPNFLKGKLVVAGVTSFGKNGTCAGQGGVYRVDRKDDLDWLDTFLN